MVEFAVEYAELPARDIKRRVVRNPNYGGPTVGIHGWRSVELTPPRYKKGFFEAMTESVKREGFRNPVIVYLINGELYLSFGASRVRVGQQLDIDVPCIVVNYDGKPVGPRLRRDNWQTFFTDVPVYFKFTEYGVDTHYSLERNRRKTYDPKGMEWTTAAPDTEFLDKEFPWLTESAKQRES